MLFFSSPLPLLTTVLCYGKVDQVDGRKVFVSAVLKSLDTKIVYCNSTALFILVNSWKKT